jgi:hypothetical protein
MVPHRDFVRELVAFVIDGEAGSPLPKPQMK